MLLIGPRAAFVLAFCSDGSLLLNPNDGNAYELNDPLCPLHSIGTVISETNMFANVQQHDHPGQMFFDFKVIYTLKCVYRNSRSANLYRCFF